MKKMICVFLLLITTSVFAGGYTPWAKPTNIEYVRGGMLVSGSFGDLNSCGQANYIFIKPTPTDPDVFKLMTSIIITAITAQREIRFYTSSCGSVGFHWAGDVVNIAYTSGGFMMH